MTKYKVRGEGREWQNQSGDTKTSTKRIEVKVRGLQVILEEAHNLLKSQEGILWG